MATSPVRFEFHWQEAFEELKFIHDESFKQAYTEIARKLRIHHDEDEDLESSSRRQLSSDAVGPWLLIVDNADSRDLLFGGPDTPTSISQYLPESEKGLILFMTRSREIAVEVAGQFMIELYEMEENEALSLLISCCFGRTRFFTDR